VGWVCDMDMDMNGYGWMCVNGECTVPQGCSGHPTGNSFSSTADNWEMDEPGTTSKDSSWCRF